MTGNFPIIPSAVRTRLIALQNTTQDLAVLQSRLASGKRVNSSVDNPSSFFAASSLNFEANDIFNLLDNLGQNKQVIKTAQYGLKGVQRLLELAGALTAEAKLNVTDSLSDQILSDNPVAYWRLNESSGTTAINLGTGGAAINGTYLNSPTLGQTPLYNSGDTATDFNGGNQSVNIPDSSLINLTQQAERTIELVFNADDITSRQVLYEEGATINALSVYIDGGRIYVGGNDQGDWGPINISAPIVAGQTYNIALVMDQPNSEFRGYLDGQLIGTQAITIPLSPHSGDIAIGRMRQGTWFYDGAESGNNRYFNGRISDVAIYNSVISEAKLLERQAGMNVANEPPIGAEIQGILSQIDELVADSDYRGTNLLIGNSMTSTFNTSRTSQLKTQGDNFTSQGLYLDNLQFSTTEEIDAAATAIRSAMNKVRKYSTTIATNISVISAREDFMASSINNRKEGSSKLTLADMNEESAKIIAAQTQQALQMQILAISFQGQRGIASMLLNG